MFRLGYFDGDLVISLSKPYISLFLLNSSDENLLGMKVASPSFAFDLRIS